jgi:hypothetical protein
MQQHVVVQLRDDPAAGRGEQAGHQGMDQAGDAACQHPQTKTGGDQGMLAIGLADRLRMITEQSGQHGILDNVVICG